MRYPGPVEVADATLSRLNEREANPNQYVEPFVDRRELTCAGSYVGFIRALKGPADHNVCSRSLLETSSIVCLPVCQVAEYILKAVGESRSAIEAHRADRET